MRIKMATAYSGGPYVWGAGLAEGLRQRGHQVAHVHNNATMAKNLLHQVGVDVVHTTMPFPIQVLRKPMVVTIQGDYTIEDNIWRRFYPGLISRADVLTTASYSMREKIGHPEAVVIPNAVSTEGREAVVHAERPRLNLATVMNFYFPRKAEGMAHLAGLMRKAALPPFRHIVVGDGPYCPTAKVAARQYGLDIRFSGFLQEPRMVLAYSDIFLYYSFHDDFPTVILEAMAHGLPVVTNQVGAVSEMLQSGVDGFVAQSDDEYVETMRNLMVNPELRSTIGANARRSVEERFNWDLPVEQYEHIYGGLCV